MFCAQVVIYLPRVESEPAVGVATRDRFAEGSLRVRSRRGWDMTEHVTFLERLPLRAVLDGELVALDADGRPDFPLICACLLQRQFHVPLVLP